MDTRSRIAFAIVAGAFAMPALCADKDDPFLKEMSRTDGNANGEFFKPEVPKGRALHTKADKAFEAEMQRTDGYVAERPASDRDGDARQETAQR